MFSKIRFPKILARRWKSGLLVAAVALASLELAWLIAQTPRFQAVSLQWQDVHFLLRGETPSSGIVLLVVDKKSLDALPEPLVEWRKHYARAIAASAEAGAKALGLVAVLARPLSDPTQDEALRAAAEFADWSMPVVCTFIAGRDDEDPFWSVPIVQWAEARNRLGFSNVYTDQDDFIRRWQVVGNSDDAGVSPSFALLTAAVFRRRDAHWSERDGRLLLGEQVIPLGEQRTLRINYPGAAGAFPRVSLAEFLRAVDRGDNDRIRDWVAGKIVLIGYDLAENRLATPFYSRWRSSDKGGLPNTASVEVQAAAIHTLLTGRFILDATPEVRIAAMLGAAGATAAIAWLLPAAGIAIGLAGVGLASLVGTQLLFRSGRMLSPAEVLLPGLLALIGTLVCRSQLAERLGNFVKEAFRRFVGSELPIDQPDDIQPGVGVTQVVSILFSDIRDFAVFCDGKDPAEVAGMLNEYRSAMTPIIGAYGGRVDKFIGDGILAIFGDDGHAGRAVGCGLEMVRLPYRLKTGVGIHSGEVNLGVFGSKDRVELSVSGDTVNVASRLEGLNKEYKTQLLFSESTRAMLPESVRTVGLGEARIRGRSQPLAVYTLPDLQSKLAASAGGSA